MAKKLKNETVADAVEKPQNALVKIVNESGLDVVKADFLLAKFDGFIQTAKEYEETARTIVVTCAEQTEEMARARKGRLYLRQMRIDIEKTRKELKEQSLKEGKAIDSVAKALTALIEPTENYLDRQERFVEIQIEERLNARYEKRAGELLTMGIDPGPYDIKNMSDDDFKGIIERAIAAQKYHEEEARREAEEKKRLAEENARLKTEADKREAELRIERERAAELERQAAEKERIEKAAESARIAAEKKAAAAPDKQKVNDLADFLEGLLLPICEDKDAAAIVDNVQTLLNKVVKYIRDNAQRL